MGRISYEAAYPGLEFLPRSRNWWARLKGTPPECIHLDGDFNFVATLLPDTLYLRGKRAPRRDPVRPEICLCRDCLLDTVVGELERYEGRVVAFEPDPENFTQYFFVATPDFEAAGLTPEVRTAIEKRLSQPAPTCSECRKIASWLWLSREQVASLDDAGRITEAPGEWFCAAHGARMLCVAFKKIAEANLFYMNLPYDGAGAYVWI